ncbi:hypothetical protein TRFO_09081 [Tritrichomonas foetus]|uniref:Uncharacterized protein n=1 Tax=Tritrichomonas foetus TaxID=1144522 RepID=A0A1J4JG95_9EUKA|nr:hypothetical protein TRFO_09081 [Tritrichomonas foetus]|eukprot:OHS98200.1 hypothetical protein TRFO_09081 [Tritrichomonas foetus]
MQINTTLQHKNDFLVIYKSQCFPISIDLFKSVSKVAKKQISSNIKQANDNYPYPYIEIDDLIHDVDVDSLKEFLNACQYKKFNITVENISDISYLSNAFEVDWFHPIIQQFYDEYPQEEYLDKLVQFYMGDNELKKENELNHEEIYIGEHLERFIRNEKILFLPFHVVYRLVERYSSHKNQNKSSKYNYSHLNNEMKIFISKCFHRYKELATMLLNVFEYTSTQEIIPFVLEPSFSFSLISSSSISAMMKQMIYHYNESNSPTVDQNQLYKDYDISIEGHTLIIGNVNSTILSGPFRLNNNNITKIKIKEGITEIKRHFLMNCMSIKAIEIASTVRKIEEEAFFNCPNIDNIVVNTFQIELSVLSFFRHPTDEKDEFEMQIIKLVYFNEKNSHKVKAFTLKALQ